MESHLQTISALRNESKGRLAASWITFDDGHASQRRHALPLLQKYGVKAIFFSIVGWVDQRPDCMTSTQLRELVSLGHEVQSHGWSHCMLTRYADTELRHELGDSREKLQDKLGSAVNAISIPFGRWDNRVLKACLLAGYNRIYTSDPSPASWYSDEVEVLGRFMVRRSTTAHQLERLVVAKGNALRLLCAVHGCKRLVRSAVGESLYHRLWGILASRKSLDEVRSEYETQPGPR